ncbi:OmpP1/FadL family transporter [Polaribacter sp. Asnod1-A03]|uniref:OmpP1/FadL family transporter n=1 Tax=Polaribacter sp. Asnod1-A03 TaxID=3160581 RepID=UPI00386C0176
MYKKIIIILLVASVNVLFGQNNTNTPYSLFGLGVENKTASAGLTGLGNTGIASSSPFEINLFNPASLGNVLQESFLYEFGLNGTSTTLQTNGTSESSTNGNISHIALAFPIRKSWAIGVGILPYTKTGYNIDVEDAIEGSTDTFYTRITGEGGLNKFYISSGFKVIKDLSLGVDVSFLFGSIDQERQVFTGSYVSISDQNNYRGIKFKTGLQYKLPEFKTLQTTIGATVELPTSLSGNQTRTSYKTLSSGSSAIIENEVEYDLDNFDLPLSYGVGITTLIDKKFTTSLDYKKVLWNDLNDQQNNESYVDQSIYAFGVEYLPSKNKFKYSSNIKYRFGLNYNTGFLQISSQKIDSYFVSAGLGLPLKRNSSDYVNISYSYGREGTLEKNLIEENFHKITVNLNFVGNWFKQRVID